MVNLLALLGAVYVIVVKLFWFIPVDRNVHIHLILTFLLLAAIRIEKEIFPEYKDDDLNLLEVTWQEDYVQQLGDQIQSSHSHALISSV